jgi:organic radical activating enzyme
MKIFPIKVEKATPKHYKFIEWKIHNVCNYDCSFCGNQHKDGSVRWLTLEKYKTYVDKLINLCNGEPVWIQLTGGEPTLFPQFIELVKYIKSKGAYVSLISNGARTLRWWKELKDEHVLDMMFITYHVEQTDDHQHIVDVLNLFHDEPIDVFCLITHVAELIAKGFAAQEYIQEHTGSSIFFKAMSIGAYDIYSKYTEEEFIKLKEKSHVFGKLRKSKVKSKIPDIHRLDSILRITNNDGSSYTVNPQNLMKDQENNFLGWSCDIGNDTMRIDSETVFRGVCEVGGARSLQDDDLSFTTDMIECTSKTCFCVSDLVSTKIK